MGRWNKIGPTGEDKRGEAEKGSDMGDVLGFEHSK